MVVLEGSTILPCLEGEASGCQITLKLVDEVRTEHHVPGFVLLALLSHPGEELVDERGVADLVVERTVFGEPNLDSGLLPRCSSHSSAYATVNNPFTRDLTWLMQRTARVLAEDCDAACHDCGLRDALVLSVAGDVGQLRTLLWRIATAPQRA